MGIFNLKIVGKISLPLSTQRFRHRRTKTTLAEVVTEKTIADMMSAIADKQQNDFDQKWSKKLREKLALKAKRAAKRAKRHAARTAAKLAKKANLAVAVAAAPAEGGAAGAAEKTANERSFAEIMAAIDARKAAEELAKKAKKSAVVAPAAKVLVKGGPKSNVRKVASFGTFWHSQTLLNRVRRAWSLLINGEESEGLWLPLSAKFSW